MGVWEVEVVVEDLEDMTEDIVEVTVVTVEEVVIGATRVDLVVTKVVEVIMEASLLTGDLVEATATQVPAGVEVTWDRVVWEVVLVPALEVWEELDLVLVMVEVTVLGEAEIRDMEAAIPPMVSTINFK